MSRGARARRFAVAVRARVAAAYGRAPAVLGARRDRLEAGARALLERETLNEEELAVFVAGGPAPGG